MIILVDICKYIILCDIITLLKANRISKLKYSIDLKYCRRLEMKKKYISLFLVILLGMIFNISNIKAYEETNDVIGQTKFVDKDGNINTVDVLTLNPYYHQVYVELISILNKLRKEAGETLDKVDKALIRIEELDKEIRMLKKQISEIKYG